MSNDINSRFSEEFRNQTVTISVQELGEIIASRILSTCDPDIIETSDPDDKIIQLFMAEILRDFGASIMVDVFGRLCDDTLEIESNK